MINLNYMVAEGYCDTPEELKNYLECLVLLPANIMSWSIDHDECFGKMRFRIEYQPLIKES